MKSAIIWSVILGILFTLMFYWGYTEAVKSRCDYYRTLHMTKAMEETCK
jgi:hypothetical protein